MILCKQQPAKSVFKERDEGGSRVFDKISFEDSSCLRTPRNAIFIVICYLLILILFLFCINHCT